MGSYGFIVRSRRVSAGVAVPVVVGLVIGYVPGAAGVSPDPGLVHRHGDMAMVMEAGVDPVLPRNGWTATANSQESAAASFPAGNAIDGNTATMWHTQYTPTLVPLPHWIAVDMKVTNTVTGLRYLPRADGSGNGRVGQYQIHVSIDGTSWGSPIAFGTFSDDAIEKTVPFAATPARFVRLTALTEAGNRGQLSSAAEINLLGVPAPTLPRGGWTTTADSQESSLPAGNVLDGNDGTMWHTQYTPTLVPLPHWIAIDMKVTKTVTGLRYLPRADGSGNGRVGQYQVHASTDGVNWGSPVASGTFPDTAAEKVAGFAATNARYVRLTALTEAGNRGQLTSAAEINIVGAPVFTLNRDGWTATADSQESAAGSLPAGNAIDGNDTTMWHTQYTPTLVPLPHWIAIDMKVTNTVTGLRYLPRADGSGNGRVGQYQIHTSTDGSTWGNPIATGTFPDTATEKLVGFPATNARYVRLTALTEAGNRSQWTAAAEINIVGVAPGDNPGVTGAWGPTVGFPLVPAAVALLANGSMLTWSAFSPYTFTSNGQGLTQTAVWNPANGTVSQRTVSNTGHDMFCPGISLLPDGRVQVSGGSNSARTSIYNPATDSWSAAAQLNIPRGYQSSVTLSDGRVFTLGGSWNGGLGGKNGEVWSEATGWRILPGVSVEPILTQDPGGVYRADNHGWFFAASNGWVFHAGPSRQLNWIDTNGSGGIMPAGNRADDQDAMNGNAVLYDIGKILTVGGSTAYDNVPARTGAFVIDINNGVVARRVGSLAYPRAFHNSVVLPDGKVLVLGGQRSPKAFSDGDSVFAPELWDPMTERFTRMAPAQVPRNYHSVALLLPDGRVFSGGGGLCGNCATNHPDGQIYSPPYLFQANGDPAPRPAITSAPAGVAPGATMTVATDRVVSTFALVRMASATHSVNTDQRRVPLTITAQNGTSYTLPVPADRGAVQPGYYMLFAMDANGVPSEARIVQVT